MFRNLNSAIDAHQNLFLGMLLAGVLVLLAVTHPHTADVPGAVEVIGCAVKGIIVA